MQCKLLFKSLVPFLIFIFLGCTTTINRAVNNYDFDKIDKLLESGYDINERDQQKRTPVIYAAYVRNNLMLKYLIKKGANVNDVDYKGCTALIYAAYYGDYDNVRELVYAGADIFIRDYDNFSAYEYSTNFGFRKIAELLKEKGADDLSKYSLKAKKE